MIVVFIVLVKDGSILLVVIYSPAAGFAPFLFLIFFNFIIMITIPSLFRASLSLVKLVKCVHEVLAIEIRAGFRL